MFKLRIPLDHVDGAPDGEIVWAEEASPGLCRICSLPAFAMGIGEGDLARYTMALGVATFVELAQDSGNGVVRVYFRTDCEDEARSFVLKILKQVRWTYEHATRNLYVFSCPSEDGSQIALASSLLNESQAVEAWEISKMPRVESTPWLQKTEKK